MSNVKALLLSFAYVAAVVASSEVIRRLTGRGGEFTRKWVHVGIGLWIIPTLMLFSKWYWAAALPAVAIVANFASQKLRLMKSIERDAKSDYGTVFFPISFVLCIAFFFKYPAAASVGIIVMALGDASAAIIGRRYGRHGYTLLGAKKSLEGSAAMLAVSFAAAFGAMVLFQAPVEPAATAALVVAVVGTVLEAAGRNGLDNLTVPVACSTLAYLMLPAAGVPS
jgi:dolichol kinase